MTGTSREAIGTPDEQIGYIASEEYASRMTSPRPQSGRPGSLSGKTAPTAESPLRQTKLPADALTKQKTNESEAEEDVIHIDPPSHRASKVHGGGYDPPTHDLGRKGGNTSEEGGWVSEHGYGTPILASDQVQKHPEAEWRQPAVSPELERRASGEYTVNEDGTPAYITKPRTHSRSSSRDGRGSTQRFIPSPAQFDRSGTPLESTKEYEPLFPEDEDVPKKAKSSVDKLKRPDLARHHFPSQDVWEDTPSSLQLETTVDTPQAPEEPKTPADTGAAQVFEKPEAEQARKENITKEDQQSFLPEHTKRFANKHLEKASGTRPGMQQRFPSQDIWEDAPDHGRLETTVSAPQTDDTNEYVDDPPAAEKPTVPARPNIPARPQKTKEVSPVDKKAPIVPGRPKPQVPARPSKPLIKSTDKVPTLGSEENDGPVPQPKPKPPVPARPAGSKIAALQAGFLKDLNSKLGLGPPKVKEPEPEPEKVEEPPKPLQDARKGRAKGPQRRKPTAAPASAAPASAAASAPKVTAPRQNLSMGIITTVWQIGESGEVYVPAAEMSSKLHAALKSSPSGAEEPKSSSGVEEPKSSSPGAEEPKSSSGVEEPKSTSSDTEELKPTSSNTEEPKSTSSSIEEPKSTSNIEEPNSSSGVEEPKASEDVLEKEEHVEPGEANLEPTTIKEAQPSAQEDIAVEEAPDEPIEDQTANKTDRITVDPSEAEPEIEDKVPDGGVSLEERKSLEAEIQKDTTEKLAEGGSEEVAKNAAPA